MSYPAAPRQDIVEDLHGHPVADPYRWLEDADDPATRAWSKAQDELARPFLDRLPGRDALASRLRELSVGLVTPPTVRGDRCNLTRMGRTRTLVDCALAYACTSTLPAAARQPRLTGGPPPDKTSAVATRPARSPSPSG